MKIMLSGGHLTPALAVIHELKQRSKKNEVVFVGREFLQEQEQMRSREQQEVEALGVKFYSIKAAKFHRTYFWRNPLEFARFIPALQRAIQIIKIEKPDVFLSFGGYLAVPLAVAAKMLKIPVVTHEQTKTAGLANALIAKFADKVAISHKGSKKHFPKEKVVLTGNPLRPSFSNVEETKEPKFLEGVNLRLPLLYVTGGSQGSHVINQTLSAIIEHLVPSMVVVHQCGQSFGASAMRELEQKRDQLPPHYRKRYVIQEWVEEEDVAWIMHHAYLVVGRSGANTVHEITLSSVPAIFIPLPFSHNNEQVKNAQPLVDEGAAMMLTQKELTPSSLLAAIKSCIHKHDSMQKKAFEYEGEYLADAAERLVEVCLELYARTSPILSSKSSQPTA